MDLFSQAKQKLANDLERPPLAHFMRPHRIEDVVGQSHLIGKGKLLRQWIENDTIPSLLFWGPPGCGKTTLANVIAESTSRKFVSLSAVLGGVKEIREIVLAAETEKNASGKRTLLFIDEIHRFNKSQQDALLPHIENGLFTLIGATTENPSFSVNSALLSRLRVLKLEAVSPSDIQKAIQRALKHAPVQLSEEAIQWLSNACDGDVRRALTLLESVFLQLSQSPSTENKEVQLDNLKDILGSSLGTASIQFDRSGDQHHDIISALIKSIRGSDPHASLYYLARLLEGGENLNFISRRLIILASEDIGNADPRALQLAVSAAQGIERVGMPEARIIFGQLVTYLAVAPKSNAAYLGINTAIEEVKNSGSLPVPLHLRNATTPLMKEFGYSKGYEYAHSTATGKPKHPHLPKQIEGKIFYEPTENGLEKIIKQNLKN